jgi:uncharacterized alpha-E superfamily protein
VSLLSRVANRIYWAARYMERAEDTARVVRSFGEVFADMPEASLPPHASWPTLVSLLGGAEPDDPTDEIGVVRTMVADRGREGSIVTSVAHARENLRTTREVLPREAWQVVNDLWLYVDREADRAVERRLRDRLLARVVDDSRRLDGVLMSTMTRDAAYDIWRLGRLLERADMTTRVVGVRAAALMASGAGGSDDHDEVHWMGVLRSLSALQMYQRATHGPIEGSAAVRFLLFHPGFPRSVAGALAEMEMSIARLNRSGAVRDAVRKARWTLDSTTPMVDDGANLDQAMEQVQRALAALSGMISDRYLRVGGGDGGG